MAANHYDTLGVPRDASTEDIKKAFRRASSQAHPDKGGSTEEQQAINRAYEVLSDPERRAQYDRTGSDHQAQSIEDEAKKTLVQLFTGAIEHSTWSILADVQKMLFLHAEQLRQHQQQARDRRDRIARHRGKVRVKKGDNLVEMLIKGQLEQIDAQIKNFDRGLAVNLMAIDMLSAYEDAPEPTCRPSRPGSSPTSALARDGADHDRGHHRRRAVRAVAALHARARRRSGARR